MTLKITGSIVASNAVNGTMIGDVSLEPPHDGRTTFQLQTNPNGYFALSDKGGLYTTWTGEALVGKYSIRIHAHGEGWNEFGGFTIRVVAVPLKVEFAAPEGSTPLPGGGWRVITPDGAILDIRPVLGHSPAHPTASPRRPPSGRKQKPGSR
jgi:hypothetical protein